MIHKPGNCTFCGHVCGCSKPVRLGMKRKGSSRERDTAPRTVSLKHPNGLTGYQKGRRQIEIKSLLPCIQRDT